MSGIIGSRHNIRGSGLVGSLGTDGQVFTSAGAGAGAVFEDAAGGGKIGQVVSTTVTAATATTTSASYEDMAGMTVDITPVASTSKVLILVDLQHSTAAADYSAFGQLVRDSTAISLGDAAGSRIVASFDMRNHYIEMSHDSGMHFLDSPSTTSAVTYKLQWSETTGTTVYLNRSGGDSPTASYGRCASAITVMEVLA